MSCLLLDVAVLIALSAVGAAGLLGRVAQQRPLERGAASPGFEDFNEKYGRTHQHGTDEYAMRQRIFERRVAEIEEINAQPGRSWTAAVNKFTDRTEPELASMRGWVRSATSGVQPRAAAATLARASGSQPSCVSWRHLDALTDLSDHNQGACGSCWAFSGSKVLQSFTELYTTKRSFSTEQIISCVENKEQCGGTGGCQGATVPLMYDYVMCTKTETNEKIPYQGTEAKCVTQAYHQQPLSANVSLDPHGGKMTFLATQAASSSCPGPSFGFIGYKQLPMDSAAVMRAMLEGPVAVSVSAAPAWNSYGGGILSRAGCPADAVINHAVTGAGFGEADGKKYWTILNSWGADWGEGGFIRLERDNDDAYCGWDKQPLAGSACVATAPDKQWVCGTCGILFEVVVPVFAGTPHQEKVAPSQKC